MLPLTLFAATGDAVVRLTSPDGQTFTTTTSLAGSGAQCLAVDPHNPQRVYAGTFDQGVYRTLDSGAHWERVGAELPHQRVLAVALSAARQAHGHAALYVGTEPSALYRSDDDGATWQDFPRLAELPSAPTWSFPPRPWTSHVRWIAPHDTDPDLLFLGIELGGVVCSRDGGQSWEDRKPGSYHDAHAVKTHPAAPGRVYEAAGGGVALSSDAGATWTPVDEGLDRHYVWGLAIDSTDPDLWYVSASYGPRQAHGRQGDAQGIIYRKRRLAPWEALGGTSSGLPRPLDAMPYALLTLRERPNSLVAGLQTGELYLSEDAGDHWRRLAVRLPALLALGEAA